MSHLKIKRVGATVAVTMIFRDRAVGALNCPECQVEISHKTFGMWICEIRVLDHILLKNYRRCREAVE
jgi:hypothetical protein